MYRFVDHQADLAVEIEADSREWLFREAITALIELLTHSPKREHADRVGEQFRIESSGEDDEELLVGVLNELLFCCQSQDWYPLSVVSIDIDEKRVARASVLGVAHQGGGNLDREVKSTTYHRLEIKPGPPWRARIVFDV